MSALGAPRSWRFCRGSRFRPARSQVITAAGAVSAQLAAGRRQWPGGLALLVGAGVATALAISFSGIGRLENCLQTATDPAGCAAGNSSELARH